MSRFFSNSISRFFKAALGTMVSGFRLRKTRRGKPLNHKGHARAWATKFTGLRSYRVKYLPDGEYHPKQMQDFGPFGPWVEEEKSPAKVAIEEHLRLYNGPKKIIKHLRWINRRLA